MKSFEEIYKEFNNDDLIIQAENKALEQRKKHNIITLLICLILNLTFGVGCVIASELMGLLAIIIVNIIIIIARNSALNKKRNLLIPFFKEQIIKKMINNFFGETQYYYNKGILEKDYNEAEYNEPYDIFVSDDYIQAKIDNRYTINIADVNTQKWEEKSDGGYYRYRVFHGLFTKIILNEGINCKLRITSNKNNEKLHKDKVEMDYSDFENNFNVFSTDKIIAMQLLTSDVMEELLKFKNIIKDDFDIFIEQNNLYLRFHCGNMFEMDLIQSSLNKSISNIIKSEIEELGRGILDEKSLKLYYDILKFTYDLSNKLIKVINEVEL